MTHLTLNYYFDYYNFNFNYYYFIIIIIMQKSLIESIDSKIEELALELDDNCQVEPFDHKYDNAEFWANATSEMLRKETEMLTLLLKKSRKKQKKIYADFENETTPLM